MYVCICMYVCINKNKLLTLTVLQVHAYACTSANKCR